MSPTRLGYSLTGVVVGVGSGATGYRVGQRVACAGNQFALHAELNWVPANLCLPVPDSVDPLAIRPRGPGVVRQAAEEVARPAPAEPGTGPRSARLST